MNRLKILLILATMPDEAFNWFVLALPPKAMMHGANAQIWPDGIGGFTDESRKSINEIRKVADEYIKVIEKDAK